MRYLILTLVAAWITTATAAQPQTLHSYALIQDDGTLVVRGRRIHLYGIYLPDTGRRCRGDVSPAQCGSRAALALAFRIHGFVHCVPQTRNADDSLNAVCHVDRTSFDEGEDLAAYLIERGWAMALPDAPFEYHAMERIARDRGMGVWGLSVDRIRRR